VDAPPRAAGAAGARAMTSRARLPNRRAHETVACEIIGQRFKIGLGRELVCLEREQLGPVREIFINAQKPNSPIDSIASDGAILLSLLLQYGCPLETIAHAMKRNPDGSPASPFGFAADLLKSENKPEGEADGNSGSA
jgi:hypothetical protein